MIVGTTIFDLVRKILLGYLPKFNPDKINFYNQKYLLPDDEGIFVTIEHRTSKIFSVRSAFSVNQPSLNYQETIDLNSLEGLSIDIMSRNLEAYQQKELFVMALSSYYAQKIQEEYGFKILRIAPINNLSSLEGSAQLYRYEIPINVFTWYENITLADYYDSLQFQVTANGDPVLKTPIITLPTKQPIL